MWPHPVTEADVPDVGPISPLMVPDPRERVAFYMRRYRAGAVPVGGMADRICGHLDRCDKGLWFIRNVHQKKVALRPRLAQAMLYAAQLDQAFAGLPVRIRALKSRKTGFSTAVQVEYVDTCAYHDNQVACTIAHEKKATRDIFRIGKYAAATHEGERYGCETRKAMVHKYDITWPVMGSEYSCATAGGTAVGAGSTPNMLHISEGPKHTGNKAETRYNSVTAVPDVPESIIVEEFTAKGRDEYFVSWCEAQADPAHPYRALFIPWFADETCTCPLDSPLWPDEDEAALVQRAAKTGYRITKEQLEWRRRKIKAMPGGLVIFRQEFPSSPEEAVMGAEGLIVRGLRDCLVTELPFDPALCSRDELVGGIDFGYMDPCCVWSGVYRDDVLWLTHFHRRTKTLAKDHARYLRPNTTYYCDPPELRERLNFQEEAEKLGLGCRFICAPRRRGPGEDVANQELRFLIDRIERGGLCVLADVAPQLLCEADTFCWNEKTAKPLEQRNDIVGHFDSIMALKYLVMGVQNRTRQLIVLPAYDDREYATRREEMLACA